MAATSGAAKGKGQISQEQIIQQFNQMRQDLTSMLTKIHELEMDQNEHSVVIDALKGVDPTRKCFRMIGGVLVERTVGDVLPALENNRVQMGTLVERLKQNMTSKEQEFNNFKEKYNIRLKGEKDSNPENNSQNTDKSSGVLVAHDKA
ncbi:prefoldin subunit 2 [Exaiptasia diaphana]|uniref:Prefoldin subunit 2 n=1 Tax=Exaiptasia diaphana TaxID=2652724 RepID=A0A913X5F0_EXADI|nr:prefoldin subunit 2 [Exaiptasia diaphana]KXJ15050.1 Prefoldin subunit 2 [Exaiptasia diaphana]